MIYTRFDQIPLWKYGLIMADPPWQYNLRTPKGEQKAPQGQYKCMSLQDIKDIPVAHYARENCLLWLWCTNPMLPEGIETLRAWGFRYVTGGHWAKMTESGKQVFGTGYVLRSAGEPYILGAIGKPEYTAKNVRSLLMAVRGRHSEKPELAFKEAERLVSGVPRLELFSRQERAGWDVFGDEVQPIETTEAAGVSHTAEA